MLPTPTSSFVGRRDELERLGRLASDGCRLVALWGPGGMGKTRLALEHARARAAAGDRVLWVSLAEVGDAASALGLVAGAAGAERAGVASASDLEALVGRALGAAGPLLLVLDNLEHLIRDLVGPLSSWLERAPAMRVLVTSRERTRLAGEATLELLPLSMGAPAREGSAGALSGDGVALFRARAGLGAALEGGRLDELVDALEGIPLAIELAAARHDVLGLEGLLSRLCGPARLDVLARPRRGRPRADTLRGAIEWSLGLLDESERKALARCAVFPASFPLEAALSVLSGLGGPLELVEALHDKSLLRLAPGDPPRFSLYQGVREVALEKLAAAPEELALAEERHATWLLSLAEDAAARFRRTGEVAALAPLERELEHLVAMVRAAPASTRALRALVAADPVLAARGPLAEHHARLDVALANIESSVLDKVLFGRGLAARGRLKTLLDDSVAAERDLDRALSLAVGSADRLLEAEVLGDLGVLAHRAGDLPRAEGLYERALAVDRSSRGEATGSRTEGRVLGNLGAIHHDAHQPERAIERYEEALAVLALNGDERLFGIVSTNLGTLELEEGSLRSARRRLERAEEMLRLAGAPRLHGIALSSLGMLHHEEGRLEDARNAHELGLQRLAVAGDGRSQGLALVRLGAVLGALGLRDEARVTLRRALAAAQGDALVRPAAELAHAFSELSLARAARAEGRAAAAKTHLTKAAQRMAKAREATAEGSLADRSDDARTLLRILSRSVSAMVEGVEEAARGSDAGPSERALLVAPEARWLRVPGGGWRDLRKRGPARRLLLALVERQREAPGAGVTLDELREAGWPGERMQSSAAANRIYVALHQLRSLGLEPLLKTSGGWLLDPTLQVRHVAVEPVSPAPSP